MQKKIRFTSPCPVPIRHFHPPLRFRPRLAGFPHPRPTCLSESRVASAQPRCITPRAILTPPPQQPSHPPDKTHTHTSARAAWFRPVWSSLVVARRTSKEMPSSTQSKRTRPRSALYILRHTRPCTLYIRRPYPAHVSLPLRFGRQGFPSPSTSTHTEPPLLRIPA